MEHVAHPRQGHHAEKTVRSLLHRMGYRFRLHVRIPVEVGRVAPCPPRFVRKGSGARGATRPTFARPDIVLVKQRIAIFVHGCFWHRHKGCKNCTTPTNRREWWLQKLNGNAARDKRHQSALRKLGWRVIVVWECEAECDQMRDLENWLRKKIHNSWLRMGTFT